MNDSQGGAPSAPFIHRPVKTCQKKKQNKEKKKKKAYRPRRPPHLYGLESTTSALILSILGLCASSLCASSAAHCLCLHLMSSFSSSRTRSFSSSTVAIGGRRGGDGAQQKPRWKWRRRTDALRRLAECSLGEKKYTSLCD